MSAEPATVLVIEDNASTRHIITSWLRRGGYRVAEAATAAEGLTRVRTEPVDVVLLDVGLPDAHGFEVCERIKAEPATAALPIIHVSALYVDVDDRTQGLIRGADAYLVEPVDPDELLATVHAALRYYRARQRTEQEARRLAGLMATTSAVNAAESFDSCLQAAVAGTAQLFEAPALVTAVRADGQVVAAEVEGPTGTAVIHRIEALDDLSDTVVRKEPISRWPATAEHPPTDHLWWVGVRAKEEHAPVHIAVAAESFDDDDARVLRQLGQAVALVLGGRRSPGAASALLTRREREIAELVAEGLTNRQISARLMIAKRTADAHVEHILAKLGFAGRAQIAAWVVEQRSGRAGDGLLPSHPTRTSD